MAVAGLGFGASFARIYRNHPDVEYVGICDGAANRLDAMGREGFTRQHHNFDELVNSPDYDAVHVCLPVTWHAEPVAAVLKSGKHCACAVPMGMMLEELRAVIAAQRASGRNFMMMETMVFSTKYLFAKELHRRGEFGRLQFLRAAHYQDLEGFRVWEGLPPMHYITHAVSPLLDITAGRASRVFCLGSGKMKEEFHSRYGNPYPIESMLFEIEGAGIAAEVTRTIFATAAKYSEEYEIYGEKLSFFSRTGELVRALPLPANGLGIPMQVEKPDFPLNFESLPESIRNAEATHGNSHPRLAHEFVRSIVEGRKPAIDAVTAANWCAVGICAHASAMQGGRVMDVPSFG
jgi:predicted dehydrogenase